MPKKDGQIKNAWESFGAKLKKLREKEGLSIEELAGQVNIKPSYLRDLEEDKFLPPVAEIITLARTLSVEPTIFMGEEVSATLPLKLRKAMSKRTSDYAYENLAGHEHDKRLMAFRVTIDPKSKHRKVGYSHEGEEFIYVLSGRLSISVGGKVSALGAGESIHFDSGKKHLLSNPGNEPTVLLVVIYVK